jgi:glycerol uptake facilitator-like aquaporin
MLNKNKWAAVAAEFLGTYVLASAVLAMFGRTSFPFFAAASVGLALAGMTLVVGKFSGGHFNPAVTIGLWSVKKFPTTNTVAFVAIQMVAGFAALRINQYLLGQGLDGSAVQTWDPKVVVAEVLGTFVFAFGVAAAIDSVYEGGKLAAALGLSLFLGVLIASFGSNGAVNPAVALGINSFSISYLVGPLVGAVLAFNAYSYFFAVTPVKAVKAKAAPRKRK